MDPIVLFIILLFAYALLMPKQRSGDNPTPSSLGDMNMPTAEAGRVLPVIFGTCKLQSPNVVWYGDFGTTEIRKTGDDVDGPCCSCCGPDPSEFSTVVGYRYYIGMNLGLCCGPVDSFLGIVINDKILWSGDLQGPNPRTLDINAPNFLGGDDRQGGIIANMHLYYGNNSQPVDSYLNAQTGCRTGYPNVCHVVVPGKSQNSGYIGTSTYMAPWHFILKRIPRNLGLGASADIGGDANPAEILYEIMTDNFWGANISPSLIDAASFKAAGLTLKTENLGMSLIIDTQSTIEDILNDVKRYINATLYTNPATGLFELKLIRDDYETENLPVLDASNVTEVKMTQAGWYETINEIKVNYTERLIAPTGSSTPVYAFKTRTAQAQDLANYFLQDEALVSSAMSFPALSNMSVANSVAYKNLSTVSQPFAKLEITTNRECFDLYPGAPFVFNWGPFNFWQRVFRVIDIEYGELVDSEIRINALEDIYGIAHAAYGQVTATEPGWTSWSPTNTDAAPIVFSQLVEVPYISWSTERVIVALVSRPNLNTDKYRTFGKVDPAANYLYLVDNGNFMPCATLIGNYHANTDAIDEVGFRIKAISDCDSLVTVSAADLLNTARNGCYINGEMLAWREVIDEGGGYYRIKGVARGIADTVPADHANGSRVWIVSLSPGLNSHGQTVGTNLVQNPAVFAISSPLVEPPVGRLTTDMTFYTKMIPGSSSGFLGESSAKLDQITTKSRAWRPYPPGRIRINGVAWPDQLHIGSGPSGITDLNITWAHREKLFQTTRTQDDVSDALEENTSYIVDIYCNDLFTASINGIVDDHLSLSATDFTTKTGYTPSNIIPIVVRIEIYAVNSSNGLESWQKQIRQFMLWGY